MRPTVDDVLTAPIGVALLDRIEHANRPEFHPFDALPDSDPDAVLAGILAAQRMTFGELARGVLEAAYLVGPWQPGAPTSMAAAYELAPARAHLAEAIWERFEHQLLGPSDMHNQQCWLSDTRGWRAEPRFRDLSSVYGNGEFTWDGFWTVTDPPPETHDDLIAAWEMHPGPITRWGLPVHEGTRIWIIDHPSDWVRLVVRYPCRASTDHAGWELPGPNQHAREVEVLTAVPNQHGVRTDHQGHLLPDWTAVAADYDGVHLSWAGFLTTEGYVSDQADGTVTMLRYWGSERTLWLRDVFGEPEALSAPTLSGSVNGSQGLDAAVRCEPDIQVIEASLGR